MAGSRRNSGKRNSTNTVSHADDGNYTLSIRTDTIASDENYKPLTINDQGFITTDNPAVQVSMKCTKCENEITTNDDFPWTRLDDFKVFIGERVTVNVVQYHTGYEHLYICTTECNTKITCYEHEIEKLTPLEEALYANRP